MKRRNFLTTLGIGAVAPTIADPIPDNRDHFQGWNVPVVPETCTTGLLAKSDPRYGRFSHFYKGYGILWTGWKESLRDPYVAGQWVGAYLETASMNPQPNGTMIYSSAPGVTSWFTLGDTFHIHPISERQKELNCAVWGSLPTKDIYPIMAEHRQEAFDSLIRYIDEEVAHINEQTENWGS